MKEEFEFNREERCSLLRARAAKSQAEVIFYGDSHMHFWELVGKSSWDKWIAPLGAVAFGVYGDTTENLKERLLEGEMNFVCAPKIIVLLIGSNNTVVHWGKEPAEKTIAGIHEIVVMLHERFPEAIILLEGLFPRGRTAKNPVRRKRDAINRVLSAWTYPFVHYLYHAPLLLDAEDHINPVVCEDGIHLNAAGYERWAQVLAPVIKSFL